MRLCVQIHVFFATCTCYTISTYIHLYIIQHIYSSYRIAQPFQGSQPDIRTKISKNNFNFQKQNTEYLNAELGKKQFVTFAATRQCDNLLEHR